MTDSVVCGLIGTGIGPSLTPPMHEAEGSRQGLAYVYRIVDLDLLGLTVADLPRLVRGARDLGFRGLNITHPCKQAVIECLDELVPDAARLGAVNTVLFDEGRAIGYNTDWTGFGRNFDRGLSGARRERVVQLGAGGAGAAVAYALLTRETRNLVLIDHEHDRARRLADSLAALFPAARLEIVDPADLPAWLADADGLVHATPMGMAGHPGSAVPAALLRPDLWVAEVVYRPLDTELLRAARGAGARTLGGGGMAVYQAADAFRIFTGIEPDAGRMYAHLTDLVGREELEAVR
ncbi:shikimate dehydrogenase [Nocardia sp. NBC_01730]|uniref:shikimate dehydrogenase n=1 Tax=Nocardia sp. NBC_01730 TaxID=2975998 RepID=UPI002E151C82|nr:shikimate dehydrogenase [Nocardia sp. NBC_01730]